MTTIIEHPDYGRAEGKEDLSGSAYITEKDGYDEVRYKKDGWREVPRNGS